MPETTPFATIEEALEEIGDLPFLLAACELVLAHRGGEPLLLRDGRRGARHRAEESLQGVEGEGIVEVLGGEEGLEAVEVGGFGGELHDTRSSNQGIRGATVCMVLLPVRQGP